MTTYPKTMVEDRKSTHKKRLSHRLTVASGHHMIGPGKGSLYLELEAGLGNKGSDGKRLKAWA